ncbi:hypothetical protein NHX12_034241 [Muraenolepis orangiensis]|uniref:Sushi domain-containing protein n=1 Tax=Muraenolepis orangiensis TaxID=630683 RepID=A0A9Q0D2Y3_9TELE|nr:hypothetical protein NHX12_034241 [Muraenolepis orangiensis]
MCRRSLFVYSELRSSACGNPGVPPKGILNGTRFSLGDKIRYRCVTGYVLDGHSLLACVSNTAGVSVWDFPVPICRGAASPCSQVAFDLLSLREPAYSFDKQLAFSETPAASTALARPVTTPLAFSE